MGLGIGIVGLPNVGKSTLFNALSGASVLAANYPFATKDPNVGVVPVPDDRLEKLSRLYQPKKTTHAALEFVDIAGLVKGASKGEGLGNQFLGNIREVDAVAHVLRCFSDPDVVHVDGTVDPLTDDEKPRARELFLLTAKPVLYVANVDESQLARIDADPLAAKVRELAEREG